MKKRLLKKRLRDVSDSELISRYYDIKLGRRLAYIVSQEMALRFEMVETTIEIELPYKGSLRVNQ